MLRCCGLMRRGFRQCKHLGLWELTPRSPPRIPKTQPLSTEPHIDYSDPSTRAVGPRSGWGPEGREVFDGSLNLGLAPPCVHSRYTSSQRRRPPQSSCPQHDVPISLSTHKAKSRIVRMRKRKFLSPHLISLFRQTPCPGRGRAYDQIPSQKALIYSQRNPCETISQIELRSLNSYLLSSVSRPGSASVAWPCS